MSDRGLSSSAVHADGYVLKTSSVFVAQTVQIAMLQMMWQESWVSLKDALY